MERVTRLVTAEEEQGNAVLVVHFNCYLTSCILLTGWSTSVLMCCVGCEAYKRRLAYSVNYIMNFNFILRTLKSYH